MNSRLTMGLAAVLLIGAIIAGYWGLVLSRQPTETAPPAVTPSAPLTNAVEDPTRVPVVVLVRDVPPFIALTADDLAVEKLHVAPAGSLASLDQVVGRMPMRGLTAGSWLSDEILAAGGPLARMIRSDERALSLAVDEVTGAGGRLMPGDYVDVLLFLPQNALNPQPSSQVALPAMRVLAVGDQLGLANDGKPAAPAATPEERLQQDQRRAAARTVVLAVPEPLLSRFLLAVQVGSLRLAVRSAEEQRLAHYWSGDTAASANLENANRSLYQFTQLALAGPPRLPAAGGSSGGSGRRGIEVIRGNQVSQQTP